MIQDAFLLPFLNWNLISQKLSQSWTFTEQSENWHLILLLLSRWAAVSVFPPQLSLVMLSCACCYETWEQRAAFDKSCDRTWHDFAINFLSMKQRWIYYLEAWASGIWTLKHLNQAGADSNVCWAELLLTWFKILWTQNPIEEFTTKFRRISWARMRCSKHEFQLNNCTKYF